ncbi:MAG: hypothetical protein JXQ90_00105 [Cyclobacteriaceae bacterium]
MKISLLSKSNLYGRLMIFIFLMFTTAILASESAFLVGNETWGPKAGGFLFSILNLTFYLYGIVLLKKIDIYPKVVIKGLWVYAIFGVLAALYVANPFVSVIDESLMPVTFAVFHLINVFVTILVLSAILKDIFGSSETKSDHVWGAVVAYFLIVMLFSEIYELITLMRPGLLGTTYQPGYPNYVQCIMFSFNSVAGVDSIYPEAHDLLRKIGNMENVIGNLFLVVVLGRLLSHPLKTSHN